MSGYDECVRVTRFLMGLLGVWPRQSKTRYRFLVPFFFMLFFIIVPQTNLLLKIWGDLNMTLEILTTADIMMVLACFKLLGIWYNKRDLKHLLVEIEADWEATEEDCDKKTAIMWENVAICRFIMKSYVIMTFGTIICYAIKAYEHTSNHKCDDTQRNVTCRTPLFVNSEFFFETEPNPTFVVVWICQFLAASIGIAAFVAFDGFFILSILHLCGQFANLRKEMKKINILKRVGKLRFNESMISIVKRHLHLNRLIRSIENNFDKVFLVQMIAYSLTLCLQGYQFVQALADNSLYALAFIVVFTTANLLSLFMYCYVANKLDTESLKLFDSAYDVHWYELKPNESRVLLMILQGSKKSIKLTAGKFAVLSYKYFTQVLRTSAGYLSMLLAMKNRV